MDHLKKYEDYVKRRNKQIEYEKIIEAAAKTVTRERDIEKDKLT